MAAAIVMITILGQVLKLSALLSTVTLSSSDLAASFARRHLDSLNKS